MGMAALPSYDGSTSAIFAVWPISSLRVGTFRHARSFIPLAGSVASKAFRQACNQVVAGLDKFPVLQRRAGEG